VSHLDLAQSASLFPRPPHLGLRIRVRPRRQKLFHHRRMSDAHRRMQRRVSILRRAAVLRQAHPLASQVRAPHPAPATLCFTKPRRGKTEMKRDNSLSAKTRCHEKLVCERQTFAVMETVWEETLLFLRVTDVKKKVRALLAPPPTPATLFTTPAKGPKENRKRPSYFPAKPWLHNELHF